MSSERDAAMLQRGVLRRLGHLLSLTSDAERNSNDKKFAERTEEGRVGGRIHYVFDTNLFELFIQPFAVLNEVFSPAVVIRSRRFGVVPGS